MKSEEEIIKVLCNEVGGAVYAGEYDASLGSLLFVCSRKCRSWACGSGIGISFDTWMRNKEAHAYLSS
jgi:hypothetical protein